MATTATTTRGSTSTGGSFTRWTGLTDGDGALTQLIIIQPFNGFFSNLLSFHLDKAEAFGPARRPISDDSHRHYRTNVAEQLLQLVLGYFVTQITYVKFFYSLGILSLYRLRLKTDIFLLPLGLKTSVPILKRYNQELLGYHVASLETLWATLDAKLNPLTFI
jgi:hypothetical protein